jgi:hypothetical protein
MRSDRCEVEVRPAVPSRLPSIRTLVYARLNYGAEAAGAADRPLPPAALATRACGCRCCGR